MMSLALALGRWNLSFELGRTEEPEEAPARVTLSDNSEPAEAYEPDVEDGFGFVTARYDAPGWTGPAVIVGEDGPEFWEFPPGAQVYRVRGA